MNIYLGEIRVFPWNWPPRTWALCTGSLLPIAQNTALFSLLGTTYGGNGVQNFGLPDMRGRTGVHRALDGSYVQGEMEGNETVTLTLSTMPMHNHNFVGTSTTSDQSAPQGVVGTDTSAANFLAPDTTPFPLAPNAITIAGSNFPHNNLQPFVVMNYSIATQGIYPSRN